MMSLEGSNTREAQLQLYRGNLSLIEQELMMDDELATETNNFGVDEVLNVTHPTASVAKRPRSIFEIGDGEDSIMNVNIPPHQFHQENGPSATAVHNQALMAAELESMMLQSPYPGPETSFDIPPVHALHPQMYQFRFSDVGANHGAGGLFNVFPSDVQGTVANLGSGNYYQPTSNFTAQNQGGESIICAQHRGESFMYQQNSFRAESVSAPVPIIPSTERPPIPIIQHLYPQFSGGQGEILKMIPSQGPSSFYSGESSSRNQIQRNTPQILSNPPIQISQKKRKNSTQRNIRVLSISPIQTPNEMRHNSPQRNVRLLSTSPIQIQHEIGNNSPRNIRMRMTVTENQQSSELQEMNSELNPTAQGIETPHSPTSEYSLYDQRYAEMGLHMDPHMRMLMLQSSWQK